MNSIRAFSWHSRVARSAAFLRIGPLQIGYAEAMLNGLASSITTPLVIPLAVATGVADWQIGILTALPLLGMNLSQVPAARLEAAASRPGAFLLVAGALGRIAWAVLAIAMLAGHVGFVSLLTVATLASVSSGLQMPLWTAFLGGAVPEDRRGSYFGTRNLLAGACGLAGAFGTAAMVSMAGFIVGNGLALVLTVIASSAAVVASAWAVGRGSHAKTSVRLRKGGRDVAIWRAPAVQGYVIYGALLILGAGMATPYYSIRFINDLGGSPQIATTAVAVANALVMLAQGLWGRVIDRAGLRLIGGASLAAIAAVPVLWALAPMPAVGVGIWLLNGLAWAACGLATFNLMLAISSDSNRASVIAWVNTLQSPVNFAAPLVGGVLAARLGLQLLFILSSAVLAAACLCFLRTTTRGQESA